MPFPASSSLQKILLIVGRDKPGDHSLAEDADFATEYWRKRRVQAEIHGNGRACLTPDEVASIAARQPVHTLIVIDAHGDPDAGHHRLRLDEGDRVPTLTLLRLITDKSDGRAIDHIIMACHAGKIFDDLARQDFLPHGTHVGTLASASEMLSGETARSFLEMLPDSFAAAATSVPQILKRWAARRNLDGLTPGLAISGARGIARQEVPLQSIWAKRLTQRFQPLAPGS